MTQGRKKSATAELVDVKMNERAVAEAGAALTVMQQRSVALSGALDGGLPYARDRVLHEARFFMSQSAEAMLEAGKRLVLLKENESRGDFQHLIEADLGLDPRVARRMMQAAVKFLGTDLAGGAKRAGLAALGKSKLYELMVLDDEQLDELAENGTVADLQLDELQTLSQRELRERVKDLQRQVEGKQKLILKREEKLRAAEEQLEARFEPSADSAATTAEEQNLLTGIRNASLEAHAGLLKLAALMRDLDGMDVPDSLRSAAHTDVQWLAQRLAEVASAAGVALDLEELAEPAWLKAGKKRRA